jgi:hypothetical protein
MSLNSADWNWAEVQVRSRALFGSPHRFRVALLASIAAPEELYAEQIASAAELTNKEAGRELGHLHDAQLLIPIDRSPATARRGRPPQLYDRGDEQAWQALQQLGQRFRRQAPK